MDKGYTRWPGETGGLEKSTRNTEEMIRQLQKHIDEWVHKKIDAPDKTEVPKSKTMPETDTDEKMQCASQEEEHASASCGKKNINAYK